MANVGNVYLGVNGQAVDLYSAKKMYVGFNNKAVEIPLGQSKFDYKTWLASASLSATGYANLDAVLQDEKAVRKLMTIHASVDYLASWKTTDEDIVKILNNDICAKWITLRDYALDTLDREYRSLMESLGKYYYGEWAKLSESPETWAPKGNVPIMTSNTAPYGTASASSNRTSREAYRAFDKTADVVGSTADFWGPTANSAPSWLQYKFTNPVCVKKIHVNIISYAYTSTSVVGYFEGSNDGSIWNTLRQFTIDNLSTTATHTNTSYDFDINNNDYYLYYRIRHDIAIYVSDSSYAGYSRLQFYGREMKVSVPAMTSNTAPYGEAGGQVGVSTAGASGTLVDPYKAFDNDDSTASTIEYPPGSTSAQFDGIWYKFPSSTVPKFASVLFRTDIGFKFYYRGSNDGTNWDNLTEEETISAKSTPTITEINNDVAYKYCEIMVKALVGSRNSQVKTLQFYGFDYSEYDWDADNPRHYLYDHGVEPNETLTTTGYSISTWTISAPTKESNQIYFPQTGSTSAGNIIGTDSTINMTDYNIERLVLGDKMTVAGDTYGLLIVNTTKSGLSNGPAAIGITNTSPRSLMYPNNVVLDVSSVNQAVYTNVNSGYSTRSLSVAEWWLE